MHVCVRISNQENVPKRKVIGKKCYGQMINVTNHCATFRLVDLRSFWVHWNNTKLLQKKNFIFWFRQNWGFLQHKGIQLTSLYIIFSYFCLIVKQCYLCRRCVLSRTIKGRNSSLTTVEQMSVCMNELKQCLCDCRALIYKQSPIFWSEIWQWAFPGGYVHCGSSGWTDGVVSTWCWEAGWLGSQESADDASQSFCPLQGVSCPLRKHTQTHTPDDYISKLQPCTPNLYAQCGLQAVTELTEWHDQLTVIVSEPL